ncbi:MAG TPA: hypothetical protein VF691_23145 [Cytophagaceae bacterium]|jgi:hypothetical protein
MKNFLLRAFLFLSAIASCFAQDKANDFDYGRVENNKYTNAFFKCEVTIPTDWIVQTKEQTEAMSKVGKAMVAGADSTMKAVLKASEINSANLLVAFQHEVGSAVDYNPSFSIITENIKNLPGIKSGKEYLFLARRLMEQSQMKYNHLDKEFTKEVINGTDFYTMNTQIKYVGLDIKQIYYSTVRNGFSFNIIISFINNQQKKICYNL